MSKHRTLKVRLSVDLYDTLNAIAQQARMQPTDLAEKCLLQGVAFLLAHAQAEAQEHAAKAADPFSIENLSKEGGTL